MCYFHLVYQDRRYTVKSSEYDIPDGTILSIESQYLMDNSMLNTIILGTDKPTFSSRDRAVSEFFLSMDRIHGRIKSTRGMKIMK